MPDWPRARQRPPVWTQILLLIVPAFALGQEPQSSLEKALGDPQPAGEVTEVVTSPRASSVAALFDTRDDIQAFLLSIEQLPDRLTKAQKQELSLLNKDLQEIRGVFETEAQDSLSFEVLIDQQTRVRSGLRRVHGLSAQLAARANLRDGQLDTLAAYSDKWDSLTEMAVRRSAPEAVLVIAANTRKEIEAAKASLLAERDKALNDLSFIADLQHLAAQLDAELSRRRIQLESVSHTAAELPLWSKAVWTAAIGFDEAKNAWYVYWLSIRKHLVEHRYAIAPLFFGLWFSSRWLLRLTGKRVREALHKDSSSMRAAAVFSRPGSAALLTTLLGVAWFGPPASSAYTNLLWALIPFPAAALAVTVFARPIRLSIYTISVVVAMMALKPFFDSMPLLSRFGIILESVMVMAALVIDFRRGNFKKAFPSVRSVVVRWTLRIIMLGLAATVLTEVIGYVGLASTLRSLVIGALGLGMVFTSLTYVLTGLMLALVHIPPLSHLPVVRNQRWTVISTCRRVIRYAMIVLWVIATLTVPGLWAAVLNEFETVLAAKIKLGAIELEISALAAGAGILVATWVLSRLVKFSLASQSMSGVNLTAGISFAISKLLRYALAVVGFLFAIVVMGFDVTKVTILAGALGVGIGFGLQTIVNNFVSGLILLFERPININDVVAVDNLMGTVRQLGIRSTIIETFDGAEVIVPNADLVSKTVTNWTKSNRRRRAEIDVGVAYGTDADTVLGILEKIARSNKEVMEDPEPFAIFAGFGDSALNFRLYVWLSDLSEVLRTPGRIRKQILHELTAADISIPFPQRDVRVTLSPESRVPEWPKKTGKIRGESP